MEIILICIGSSVLTSFVVTKILAVHYLDVLDGYVTGCIKDTVKFVRQIVDETKEYINECRHG